MADHRIRLIVEAVDRASRTLRDSGAALSRLGDEATTTANRLRPLGTAMTALGAAGTAVVASSVLTAARTEELGLVLNVLAENAREAAEAEGDLARAQALSTEGVWQAVEAVRSRGITQQVALQLVSQFVRYELDMARATDLARLAQDAAVLSMQDSSEALSGLLHGVLTYNPLVLRTYGITVQADQAFDEWADTHGVLRDEMDNTQRAMAMLDAVLEEGVAITGAYEAAMGSAGKQLRSFTGRELQELSEALGEAYLPLFGEAIVAARDLTKAFLELEPATQAQISRFVAVGSAVSLAGGSIILLTPKVIALARAVGTLATFGGNVVTAFRLIALGTAPVSLGLAGVTAVALPLVAVLGTLVALQIQADRAARAHAQALTVEAQAIDERAYQDYLALLEEMGAARNALSQTAWEALEPEERHAHIARVAAQRMVALREQIEEVQSARELNAATTIAAAQAEIELLEQMYNYHAIQTRVVREERELNLLLRGVRPAAGEAAEGIGEAAEAAADAEPLFGGLADTVSDLGKAFADGMPDGEDMWDLILETGREAGLTAQQLGNLAVSLGVAEDEEVQARLAMYELVSAWDAGTRSGVDLVAMNQQLAIYEQELALAEQATADGALEEAEAHREAAQAALEMAIQIGATGREIAEAAEETDGLTQSLDDIPREVQLEFRTEKLERARREAELLNAAIRAAQSAAMEVGLHPSGTGAQQSYQHGTAFVPVTGPALLHAGEAVLPARLAAAYRAGLPVTRDGAVPGPSSGGVSVTIYGGLTLEGVQDAPGLLEQLQALSAV